MASWGYVGSGEWQLQGVYLKDRSKLPVDRVGIDDQRFPQILGCIYGNKFDDLRRIKVELIVDCKIVAVLYEGEEKELSLDDAKEECAAQVRKVIDRLNDSLRVVY